jgi:hypothetical protein
MEVIGFGCGPWRWYKDVGEIHMNKGRVGEERRGKKMDRCPLTGIKKEIRQPFVQILSERYQHPEGLL